MQARATDDVEYLPAGQNVQSVAPAVEPVLVIQPAEHVLQEV